VYPRFGEYARTATVSASVPREKEEVYPNAPALSLPSSFPFFSLPNMRLFDNRDAVRSTGAFLAGLIFAQMAVAQTPATPGDLRFSGTGENDTTVFTIPDRWEITWMGPPASVSVETADGALVTGSASAGGPGSLFVATGGSYKLHVSSHFTWVLTVHAVGPAGGTLAATGLPQYVPPDMTSASPFATTTTTTTRAGDSVVIPPNPATPTAPAAPQASPGAPVAFGPGGAPMAPTLTSTPTASVVPPPPTAAAPRLTEAQASAVVLIRGDNAEGTGFLVQTAAGSFVVTNQHVIAANPHLHITTGNGLPVTFTDLQGATDRDLAMIPIQDNHYSYLTMASDVAATVQVGDAVITPGNSEGGEVMLDTNGTVLALGPQKIEISNPVYHGNSGGPVLHVKSGTVIGVVTEGQKVDTTDALDLASHQNANSAITGTMRYFGLRLDNVGTWEPFTWARFENETEFLDEFHERSKCLDSYLNTASNDTTTWGLYCLRDEKIKAANDELRANTAGADTAQQIDSERSLVLTLDGVADSNMQQIEQPSNFYHYDQIRARDELAYRSALKKEIADMNNNVERTGHLVRTNSSQ
jgi:S1-C subfamily serine protease